MPPRSAGGLRMSCVPFTLGPILGLVACAAGPPGAAEGPEKKALEIYFVDTEGGAATLIVTPAGESLLIDPGYPGDRDPERIAGVARDVAGLREIDAFVSTHFDADHYASLPRLLELIPIRRFYDRGVPDPVPSGIDEKALRAYVAATGGKSTALKPGDEIPFRPCDGTRLRMKVLAAGGIVIGEKPGAPQARPCDAGHETRPDDRSENANSVAILLEFGRFRLFAGGDLTWNVEHKLVCPENLPGEVDVFQVNHHGFSISNNPVLVRALNPRVAILLNGPTKGGEAEVFARLRACPGLKDIFAMHRNLRAKDADNADPAFTLSTADEASCAGGYMRLTVRADGEEYAVAIPAKGTTRTYAVR